MNPQFILKRLLIFNFNLYLLFIIQTNCSVILRRKISDSNSHPKVLEEFHSLQGCPGEICGTLAGDAVSPLLAGANECAQQDMADKWITVAKTQIKDPEVSKKMIELAIEYRKTERNTFPDPSKQPAIDRNSLYCQKPPKNHELDGVVQVQSSTADPNLFFDPKSSDGTGTLKKGSDPRTIPLNSNNSTSTPVNSNNSTSSVKDDTAAKISGDEKEKASGTGDEAVKDKADKSGEDATTKAEDKDEEKGSSKADSSDAKEKTSSKDDDDDNDDDDSEETTAKDVNDSAESDTKTADEVKGNGTSSDPEALNDPSKPVNVSSTVTPESSTKSVDQAEFNSTLPSSSGAAMNQSSPALSGNSSSSSDDEDSKVTKKIEGCSL